MKKQGRLLSLDVLRGITIFAMILVNNPGAWGKAYYPLTHAPWHGITPTDLIYPFFIFIVGISVCFSLSKYADGFNSEAFWKILKRSIIIFAIGSLLHEVTYFARGTSDYILGKTAEGVTFWQAVFPFETFRAMGVLQGIAVAYLFGATIALITRYRYMIAISVGIMVLYVVILHLGNGYELDSSNIIAVVDTKLFGENHLYKMTLEDGTKIPFEPEALLSSLTRIAQVLLGVFVGKILVSTKDNTERMNKLFIFGTIALFSGMLLQYGDPINKNIWTSAFTLVTTGFASLLLSLLIWIIDVRNKTKWSRFFESFGANPLFLYALAWVMSVLLNYNFRCGESVISLKGFFYKECLMPLFGEQFGCLVYSLLFIFFIWIFGYMLFRKKIYIKI